MVEIGSDAKRKNLRYREDLTANLFRIMQTESKLKREELEKEKKLLEVTK